MSGRAGHPLLALLLLTAPAVRASPDNDREALVGRRIAGVVLVTPPGREPGDLARFLEVRKGDLYTAAAVRRTIEVLSKLGDFADVRVEALDSPSGIYLTIRLTPVARIARITYQGVAAGLPRVASALGVAEGDAYPGQEDLGRMDEDIRNAYLRDGWPDARARVEAVPLPGGDVELKVGVAEGARQTVTDVEFSGDLAFTPETLSAECGLGRGDPVTDATLSAARDRIVRFHRKEGYLEVRVSPPTRTADPPGGPGHKIGF